MFFFVLSQVWDKEKILSSHEELNLRPLDSTLYLWATQTPWWARSITKFVWQVSCILLGDSIVFVDRNKRDGKQ